jgi:putative ABC transport system permease protein
MSSFTQDVRYALRGLRNRPGFTALAVLTLALGIGATTTMFSVIQNVLLDPFPYKDAERVVLMRVHDDANSRRGGRGGFRGDELLDYQEKNHVFEDVIAGGFQDVIYTTADGAEQFSGGLVTPNTFDFLGVPAAIGRTLSAGDAKPDAPAVFVMAHKLWLKRFNLDPSILGQTFMLDGVPTTLVGIMPQRFTKLDADIYRPVALDRANAKVAGQFFRFQGKLKPGVTLPQAQAELNVLGHQFATVYPKLYPEKFSVQVVSWVDELVGGFRKTLYTLGAAVALLLLIACANVANMLLARATAREKEMAIRTAIGATRWRLVNQLLVESLVLAFLGAVVGSLFAYGGIATLVSAMPSDTIPHESVIRMNVPVLLFSLGLSMVTAVLFGLVPAVQTVRQDLVEPLKDGARGSSGGFRRGKLRSALVVIEVALSLVLLTCAGLVMRSFIKLQTVDLGFDPKNMLVAQLPLDSAQYASAGAKNQFFQQLLPRLQRLPGVVSATVTSSFPPYFSSSAEIDVPGQTHADRWQAGVQLCSEGYFQTFGIKPLRGELLTETDVANARHVIVVNQTFAKRFFGDVDPIGRRVMLKEFRVGADDKPDVAGFEIKGVVADIRNQGLQDPPAPELFMAHSVTGSLYRGIYLRTSRDPESLVNDIRRQIWAVDRGVSFPGADSLVNFMKRFSYAEPRFVLIVLGVFAAVGLLLVAIGVYSVIAYTVSRQTHEIGIRLALGATRGDVLRLVMRMGMFLVGLGLAIGLLLSIAVTRILQSQLWNVSPYDPVTFVAVMLVIAAAGLAACYFPARRATQVDPMIALRYD